MSEDSSVAAFTKPKKIRLYRNGDRNFFGRDFLLAKRWQREQKVEEVLPSMAEHVGLPERARLLCTPRTGTQIEGVHQLEEGGQYVLCGYKNFQRIQYENLAKLHEDKLKLNRRKREQQVKTVQRSRIIVSARYKKEPENILIYVYCNGEPYEPAKRIVLTPRMATSGRQILAEVTRHMPTDHGKTVGLVKLDGSQVVNVSDIQSGAFYVAVGQFVSYLKLNYGGVRAKPRFDLSPKPKQKSDYERDRSRNYRRSRVNKPPPLSLDYNSDDDDVLPPLKGTARRTQSDPYYGNRHSRNDSYMTSTTDQSMFPMKPVKYTRKTRHQQVDYDKDEGGIFKAKGTRKETLGADEVRDTNDTRTDLPLDFTEATVVNDEEIDEMDTRHNDNKQNAVATKSMASGPKSTTSGPKSTTSGPKSTTSGPKSTTSGPKSTTSGQKEGKAEKNSSSSGPDQTSSSRPANQNVTSDDNEVVRDDEKSGRNEDADDVAQSPYNDKLQQNTAAVKIQSTYRGHYTRKQLKSKRSEVTPNIDNSKTQQDAVAATKIQSAYRGHRTRKELKSKSSEGTTNADNNKHQQADVSGNTAPEGNK